MCLILRFSVAAGIVLVSLCQPVRAQPLRTVVSVNWSSEDFPSTVVIDAAIRQTFRSRDDMRVDFHAEYLESDRFPGDELTLAFRDYVKRKYAGRRIDAVIAVSEVALQFVAQHRQELFPDAHVVFSASRDVSTSDRPETPGVTGVVGHASDAETLELALELHPATERVFVVAHVPADFRDEYLRQVRLQLAAFAERVEIGYLAGPLSEVIAAVKAIPERSLVLYLRHSQEEPGRIMHPHEIARLVAEASPVPVYGIRDAYIGSGVVGGMMPSTHTIGVRLAEIACRLLGGASSRDVPIEHVPLVPTFDWRQVQRWGIGRSRLPAGSDIRFRVPTAWEQYQWHIVGTLALLALQTFLIGGLVAQHARRRRAEAIIRGKEAALRSSYDRIRDLAGQLITAQELARTQIARDLHDDVCQELASMTIEIAELQRHRLDVHDAHAQFLLSSLHRRAQVLVDSVRRLSHDLHPSTLRHVGLAASLEAHCIEVEQRYDTQVGLVVNGSLIELPEETALCLFRIAQEALRNAATHGSARRITVTLSGSASGVELVITDDGEGFDVEAARRRGGGLGLVSMHERARLVGGHVVIDSRAQQGTSVRVRVPTLPGSTTVHQTGRALSI